MEWAEYLGVLRRRWWILLAILLLDLLVSGLLYARSVRHLGYQACATLYVADVSSASLITAPPTTLAAEGQLLAGETAANFFADDIIDVAESQHVARFVSANLAPQHLAGTDEGSINGAVSGSRRDRVISLCANNPSSQSAVAVASGVASAMANHRARFVGPAMAKRTYVGLVSDATAAPVSASHERLTFILRLIVGALLAAAIALLAEALDTRVVSRRQAEALLTVPVVPL